MPELPEVALYLHALESRVVGSRLERLRVRSPSLLRTYDPPASALEGRRLLSVRPLAKRIVFDFEDDLHAVLHLMITGRLQWKPAESITEPVRVPRKTGHAAFDFESGTLLLTEQATKKRASLHVVLGEEQVQAHHRGGVEPLEATFDEFAEALQRENRTLKRALTDQRLVSGIGNAHSDEILLEARLSPVKLTSRLEPEEVRRLYSATQESLKRWTDRLIGEWGDKWPRKVTAFHPKMAAHGRYGEPCPVCSNPIQRIVYSSRETNYCAHCQTGGKLLADRGISRLLKQDWPKTLEELEEHIEARSTGRGQGG